MSNQIGLNIYYSILVLIDTLSSIFYISLLIFLGKRLFEKEKNGAKTFHILFMVVGWMDMLFIVEEYLSFRLPQFGLFETFYMEWFRFTSLPAICFTYSIAQIILTACMSGVIALNRFTAIAMPTKYLEVWCTRNLVASVLIPTTLCAIFFGFFCGAEADYSLSEDDGRMSVFYVNEFDANFIFFTLITAHASILVIIGLLNYGIIHSLKKQIKTTNTQIKTFRIDIILIKYAHVQFFLLLITFTAELLQILSANLQWNEMYNNLMSIYLAVETTMIFFSPFALLILSKDIRNKYFVFMKIKSPIQSSNTIVPRTFVTTRHS
uniref:Serpentine receptor class gamma n=1 Tax=Rhabditophanes sp. KR3021 TaxID=114890 RepID=A0AC35TU00_9BILA